MRTKRRWVPRLAASLWFAAFAAVAMPTGNEQVAMVTQGRFEELEAALEPELERAPLRTRDLHALCYAYSRLKRYDRLLACLDRLEANVAGGDPRTRLFGLDDATPAIYVLRADARIDLGDYAAARREAERAVTWIREQGAHDRDLEIQALGLAGIAALLAGERALAEARLREIEALELWWPLHGEHEATRTVALTWLNSMLGHHQRVVELLEDERSFTLNIRVHDVFSGSWLHGTGSARWPELLRMYLLGHALLETGRLSEARATLGRLGEMPQTRALGDLAWRLSLDLGRIAEAERQDEAAIGHYRAAMETLERQRATIPTEASRIGFLATRQQVYARLVERLFDAGRIRDAFVVVERAKARALLEAIAARRADPPAQLLAALPAPEEIQAQLAAGAQLVEYYQASPGSLYAFVIDARGLRARRLEAQGLDDEIERFRRQLARRDPQAQATARALHARLIAPLEAWLSSRDVAIVAHGALHLIPFAALHDGRDFLVERFAFHHLPSASTLALLRRPAQQRSASLVIGNPALGDPGRELPEAEREAGIVGRLAPAADVLIGAQASKAAFVRRAPAARYIHVAAHGEYDRQDPRQTRLLLAPAEGASGALTVAELYALRLDADLVTLSACRSGVGAIAAGDEVIGLPRSFLLAGARNVAASLWDVDDRATAELMAGFYEHLNRGDAKRESLRQAQAALARRYPHPYYWAAFYLIGRGD